MNEKNISICNHMQCILKKLIYNITKVGSKSLSSTKQQEALIQQYEADVNAFLPMHLKYYSTALEEIIAEKKQTHWMWFIFPQLAELGESKNSKEYGIQCTAHAKAYLKNQILRTHLYETSNALLNLNTDNIHNIFENEIDCIKLKSSMTLFDYIEPESPIFNLVLVKYFNCEKDQLTLDILNRKNI